MNKCILYLDRPIQVRLKQKRKDVWVDATITAVTFDTIEQELHWKHKTQLQVMSFTATLADNKTIILQDAFGENENYWRYKEHTCSQCKWQAHKVSTNGGINELTYFCDCPNFPPQCEPMEAYKDGELCPHMCWQNTISL